MTDEEEFGKLLMEEERRSWQNPEKILSEIGLEDRVRKRHTFNVADLGCGPGFFTIPISRLIGNRGVVYAVDWSKVMIRQLRNNLANLAKETMKNVVITLADLSVGIPSIPKGNVDLVLFANIFHDITDKGVFLNEVKRISRSEDSLIVDIDWQKRNMAIGPPVEMRLGEREAKEILENSGLTVVRKIDAGPYHYGLVLGNKKETKS